MGSVNGNGESHPRVNDKALKPIFTPRRTLSVVVIGAGASGLMLAYKIQRSFDDFTLEVFEKNPEVSGTWYENRYPGCACDIPAHNYTWSFEPNPGWSSNYANQREIFDYFKGFCSKHGLERYIKLRHKVIGARWDDAEARWNIEVENLATGEVLHRKSHVLINAGGILNAWKWPEIRGIEEFKGTLVHSAAWPEEGLELAGKTVGLIGNGSSAVQILPSIRDEAGKVVAFIRSPTWIVPGMDMGNEYREYTEEEKRRFAEDPQALLNLRREFEEYSNMSFDVFRRDAPEQVGSRMLVEEDMRAKLAANPELEKALVPEFPVGCRRMTPGTGYLESLLHEKVQPVLSEISHITATSVVTADGGEHAVDVLICATGFDTSFKPRFPIIGASGANLARMWKDEPKAYFGIAVDYFPNYLMTLGPNCPIGNGTVLVNIEAEADYFVKLMGKFQKENLRSFEIRSDAVREFNEWKDEFMKDMVWTESCRSWYKGGTADGKVTALWPGSTVHYLEAMSEPRWEDWRLRHDVGANRYAYLGNGISSAQELGGDLAYYIRNRDDGPVDPVLKRPKNAGYRSAASAPQG